jgi:hypothetical protein
MPELILLSSCRSGAARVRELQMKRFIGLLGVALAISSYLRPSVRGRYACSGAGL